MLNNRTIRLIFHLFQIGFLLMNYFRWPTECGISEIIIFAFVLKLIEQEFDKQPEYKRKRKRIEMVYEACICDVSKHWNQGYCCNYRVCYTKYFLQTVLEFLDMAIIRFSSV